MNDPGRIVSFDAVERAVAAQLQAWVPWYIARLEEQLEHPAGYFEAELEYVASSDFGRFSEDRLPCVVVVCPGLDDPPVRDDGVYRCTFAVLVGVFASAIDRDTSDAAAKAYGAAIRACLVQRPRIGALDAGGVKWVGERYDEVDADDSRSLVGGVVRFAVEVDDVLTTYAGPLATDTPPVDPYAAPTAEPTAATHTLTIDALEADA